MKELNAYFKSIIDQERVSVVICSLQHEIIYMNPAQLKIMQSAVARHS